MADPFVATLIRGVTEGVLRLSDEDGSERWWLNFKFRYQEVRRKMGPAEDQGGDSLDLIARWFILYQPEKLAAKGVNLDGLKHK